MSTSSPSTRWCGHPSLPFLIRCGSTALSQWNHYTKACGPSRDQLPELIRFSYTASSSVVVEVAKKDMEVKLKQLGVVYSFMDMRSQPIEESRADGGSLTGRRGDSGGKDHRLVGMLLPRDISQAPPAAMYDRRLH